MSAAGDLVFSLRADTSDFSSGMSQAVSSAQSGSSAIAEHVGGGARAFGFLGSEIGHAGEALKGTNEGLGEMVGGLGTGVSVIGETVHGLHSMHAALGMARNAQIALNAVSPAGWAMMAAGAVAAAGSYLFFKNAADQAAAVEERKKNFEPLEHLKGDKFDDAAETKEIALQEALTKATREYGEELQGTGLTFHWWYAGFDEAAGRMNKAGEALDDFMAKAVLHRQQEASGKVDSTIDALIKANEALSTTPEERLIAALSQTAATTEEATAKIREFQELTEHNVELKAGKAVDDTLRKITEQAANLDVTPLEKFKNDLRDAHTEASDAADAVWAFVNAQEQIKGDAIGKELGKSEQNLDMEGMDRAQRYMAEFANAHPTANPEQTAQAQAIADRMTAIDDEKDAEKELDELHDKAIAKNKKLADVVQALVDGPYAAKKKQLDEINEALAAGVVSKEQAETATQHVLNDLEKKQKPPEDTGMAKGVLKGSQEAYLSMMAARGEAGASDPAKKTNEQLDSMIEIAQRQLNALEQSGTDIPA